MPFGVAHQTVEAGLGAQGDGRQRKEEEKEVFLHDSFKNVANVVNVANVTNVVNVANETNETNVANVANVANVVNIYNDAMTYNDS
jgi:hypothetical protein